MVNPSQQEHHGGNASVGFGRVPALPSAPDSSSRNPHKPPKTLNGDFIQHSRATRQQDLIAIGTHTASLAPPRSVEPVSRQAYSGTLASLPNDLSTLGNTNPPWHCQPCNRSFTTKSSLGRHVRTKHKPDECKKFHCPKSDCRRHHQPFLRKESLVRHQQKFLHFDDSTQPWTVYDSRHALPETPFGTHREDLDQLLEVDHGSSQPHRQPLQTLLDNQPVQPEEVAPQDPPQDQRSSQLVQSTQSSVQLTEMSERDQRQHLLARQSHEQSHCRRLRALIPRLQTELTVREKNLALITTIMDDFDKIQGPYRL